MHENRCIFYSLARFTYGVTLIKQKFLPIMFLLNPVFYTNCNVLWDSRYTPCPSCHTSESNTTKRTVAEKRGRRVISIKLINKA